MGDNNNKQDFKCSVLITHGVQSDAQLLIDLERDIFGARAWPNGSIANAFSDAFSYVLFARLGSAVRVSPEGFLVWRQIADEAEVLSIGVLPSARGKKLAKALMGDLERVARSKRLMRIILDVDINNVSALALYGACGYHRTGTRRNYYRNGADAMVMAKMII